MSNNRSSSQSKYLFIPLYAGVGFHSTTCGSQRFYQYAKSQLGESQAKMFSSFNLFGSGT